MSGRLRLSFKTALNYSYEGALLPENNEVIRPVAKTEYGEKQYDGQKCIHSQPAGSHRYHLGTLPVYRSGKNETSDREAPVKSLA